MHDFEQKHASKYTSTFSSEPRTRPSYIPQTTVVNGTTYNVYYDYSHGGYGYWNGGIWTTYSVVRDAVMLDALMNQHNYYYGPRYEPGYEPTYGFYPVQHHSSFGGFLFGFICIVLLIIGAVIVVRLFGI